MTGKSKFLVNPKEYWDGILPSNERPSRRIKVQFQAISEIDDEDIANQLRQDHIRHIGYLEFILKKGVREGSISSIIDARGYAFLFNGAAITLNMLQLLALNIEFIDNHIDQFLDQYRELVT